MRERQGSVKMPRILALAARMITLPTTEMKKAGQSRLSGLAKVSLRWY